MSYDELAQKIAGLSIEMFRLGQEAGKFENCRIMHIAEETLEAMSYSLDAIVESLTEE